MALADRCVRGALDAAARPAVPGAGGVLMTGPPLTHPTHDQWLVQIDAELDGALSLGERAALANHLGTCAHCAGARANPLEVGVALVSSAGNPRRLAVPA